MRIGIALSIALAISISARTQVLKPIAKFKLNIEEVSDLKLHPNGTDFIATTDFGLIHHLDSTFEIQFTSPFQGDDFEGLCILNDTIYVSEDRDRQLILFLPDSLEFIRAYTVPFVMRNGDHIEGMIALPHTNRILLFSEEKPIEIFSYNPRSQTHEVISKDDLPEIASLDFWNGRLFALSDESPELIELNPTNLEIIGRWRIRVNNAEGLCFRNGYMYIVSDELRKAFQFEIPSL